MFNCLICNIEGERLVQLPNTPRELHDSQDLSSAISNDVHVKVANLEDSLARSPKQISDSEGIVKACPKIFKTSNKFYQSVVREQVVAQDVDDCATKCKQASYCKSFAFR